MNPIADIVSVEQVGVRLGGRTVLDDVSFSIRPGEFTGLIGSNGAGKTTLLKVILGLQRPDHGRVLFDGQPRTRGQRLLGYVPQKFLLDPDTPMRARDLVALGLDAHRLGPPMPSRGRRRRVQAMLDAVGARDFANARVGLLSGGEQQRILIAHALIARPRLLLLDEPLANLDISSGHEVVALLARLVAEEGVAVLLSAHEMNPLIGVMDRIVYTAGGRVASGRADEIVRADVLSRLYGRPVEVLHIQGRVIVVAGRGDPNTPGAGVDGVGAVEVIS